jgi:ABC-type amino acid transport substrate-binding protein
MGRFFKLPLLLLVLLIPLAGCSTMQGNSQESSTNTLSSVQQRGELILGTSGTMAPMTMTDSSGKPTGFDVDLARLMADVMEVKLTVKTIPFPELIPALQKGEVDLVISNMTITPKRNMQVAFVGPYLKSGKCIITKDENIARATQSDNINRPETRMVALKGSTSEDFIKTLLPYATLNTVDDVDSGVQMVIDGKAGGMLTDYPICLSALMSHPDDGFVSLFSLLTYEPIGIALPANDPQFINWTENFLLRLNGTNTLQALGRRWLGIGVSVEE